MKARSVVLTHIQWPATVFGLPPKLMALSVFAAMAVYVLTVIAGVIAISMIGFGITLVAGLGVSYRLGRSDRHVETLFLTTTGFWRSSSRRWLLAGAYPRRSRGGGS